MFLLFQNVCQKKEKKQHIWTFLADRGTILARLSARVVTTVANLITLSLDLITFRPISWFILKNVAKILSYFELNYYVKQFFPLFPPFMSFPVGHQSHV